MRTIKQLLQLMLDNKHLFDKGLCAWVWKLQATNIITLEERKLLHKYIYDNRPEFKWYNPYMLFNDLSTYYWIEGCITPRIKWLEHHISIN